MRIKTKFSYTSQRLGRYMLWFPLPWAYFLCYILCRRWGKCVEYQAYLSMLHHHNVLHFSVGSLQFLQENFPSFSISVLLSIEMKCLFLALLDTAPLLCFVSIILSNCMSVFFAQNATCLFALLSQPEASPGSVPPWNTSMQFLSCCIWAVSLFESKC